MLKWFKQKIARRIRRIAQADETQNRLRKLEDRLRELDQKVVDRDAISEFVFLAELRSKSYIDDAVSRVSGGHSEQNNAFITPEFQTAFENHFAEPTQAVRERLKSYIPLVAGAAGGRRVVDIGCGTGAWLGLARDAGFSVQGVETNVLSVDECRRAGFDVLHVDAISFLNSVERGSIGAVTFFHVIEHLSLDDLFSILSAARTALAPGGLFLAEFHDITASGNELATFWINPAHLRPIHPEFVQFMAGQAGFQRTDLHRTALNPESTDATTATENHEARSHIAILAWA